MTGILESILASIAGRAIYDACQPLVGSAFKTAARRGHGKAGLYDSIDRNLNRPIESYWPVSLVGLLPRGVTQQQINIYVASPEFATLARQMVALKLLNNPSSGKSKMVLDHLRYGVISLAPPALQPEMDTYAAAFCEHFENLSESMSREIVSKTKGSNDVVQLASSTILVDTLSAIERYAELLSRSTRLTSDYSVWARNYVEGFVRFRGDINLPDLDERRRMSYESLYVHPSILEADYRILDSLRVGRDVITAVRGLQLSEFIEQLSRGVLLGDPGAGKSTTCTIAAIMAYDQFGRIPFVVDIRSLPDPAFNLTHLIWEQLRDLYQIRTSEESIERVLYEGHCTLVFDGLDENRHGVSRAEIAAQIERLAHYYPYARILVTCRFVGYAIARFNRELFGEYSIAKFSLDVQVPKYAENWLRAKSGKSYQVADLADFLKEAKRIPDLVSNPLLLAFILILYNGRKDIPRTRHNVYRQCVDLLLGIWDHRRSIATYLPDREMARTALSRVAYLEKESELTETGLTEEQLKADLIPFAERYLVASRDRATVFVDELLDLCRGRAWIFTGLGKDQAGDELFSFTHGSFREYFLALYVVRTERDAKRLNSHLYESAVLGDNEVYGQVCLNLIEAGKLGAASDTLIELIERVESEFPRLNDNQFRPANAREAGEERLAVQRAAVIKYLSRASDSIPLTPSAARRLIRLAIEQVALDDVSSLAVLMEETYYHQDAVLGLLEHETLESLKSTDESRGLRYLWLAANVGYLTNYMAEGISSSALEKIRPLAALIRPRLLESQERFGVRLALSVMTGANDEWARLSSDPASFSVCLEEWFSAFRQPISSLGPQCVAAWVFDCLSSASTERLPMRPAASLLRAVGRAATQHSHEIPSVHIPIAVGIQINATQLVRILDVAFRRSFANDLELRIGLTYLAAWMIEVVEAIDPAPGGPRELMQEWLNKGVRDEDTRVAFQSWIHGSRRFWIIYTGQETG